MTIQSFEDFERETIAQAIPFKSGFGARWFHQIGQQKPQRNWLLKNLLLAGTFGVIYGPPGCGKSFITTDMGLTMAAGALPGADRPKWFGYKGRPFGVVYVVAEGADDFEIRLHTWRLEHGIAENVILPFVFLPTNVDLRSNNADAKKLAHEVRGLSAEMLRHCGVAVELVVIDTVARALAGGNENASEIMSSFVLNCQFIQKVCGVTVLGVHHGGKEGGRGPRGHEALHGAADFEIEVVGGTPETPNRWVVKKLKAGPGGATHLFRLRQTKVGVDEEGDSITSCIVTTGKDAAGPKQKEKAPGWRVNDMEREVLTALASAIDKHGTSPAGDMGLPEKVLLIASSEDVKRIYLETLTATESGDPEEITLRLGRRWSRGTKSLMKFKVIGSKTPFMWFTGKEVQRFRLRGIASDVPTYVAPEGELSEADIAAFTGDQPPPPEPPPQPADDYEVTP